MAPGIVACKPWRNALGVSIAIACTGLNHLALQCQHAARYPYSICACCYQAHYGRRMKVPHVKAS